MPLDHSKFSPLRTWAHKDGDVYDLTADPWTIAGYHKRYAGRGKHPRINVTPPSQHPNVHGDAVLPGPDDVLPQSVKDALASLGFADGEYPTKLEWTDMDHFIEAADYPGYASGDCPVLFRVHVPWLQYSLYGEGEPGPMPPPPNEVEVHPWLKPAYESEHNLSNTMPEGSSKIVVSNLESAWYGVLGDNALVEMGTVENVISGADDPLAKALVEARGTRTGDLDSGLLVLLQAVKDGPHGTGPITLAPEVEQECQLVCDRFWNAVGNIEQAALSNHPQKYQYAAPGYQAPCKIEYSQFYNVIGTMLRHMSDAAQHLSLSGRLKADGTRDAWYVDPFQSWLNQDPWYAAAHGGSGSGGIGLPGAPDSNAFPSS